MERNFFLLLTIYIKKMNELNLNLSELNVLSGS